MYQLLRVLAVQISIKRELVKRSASAGSESEKINYVNLNLNANMESLQLSPAAYALLPANLKHVSVKATEHDGSEWVDKESYESACRERDQLRYRIRCMHGELCTEVNCKLEGGTEHADWFFYGQTNACLRCGAASKNPDDINLWVCELCACELASEPTQEQLEQWREKR